MCEADKGRKAAQALIRRRAVGQIIIPLSSSASKSGSVVSTLSHGKLTTLASGSTAAFIRRHRVCGTEIRKSKGSLPGHTLTEEGGCVSWLNLGEDEGGGKSAMHKSKSATLEGQRSLSRSPPAASLHCQDALASRRAQTPARWGHTSNPG